MALSFHKESTDFLFDLIRILLKWSKRPPFSTSSFIDKSLGILSWQKIK